MVTVRLSSSFREEKEYIIDILFSEFLGLKYELEYVRTDIYEVILENDNILRINDAFFGNFDSEKSYLNGGNIPKKISYLKESDLSESIPVIYGNGDIEILEKEVILSVDIFASSFFMLTRWEEYVVKTRDEHGRFAAKNSLAYKFRFLDRAIVNEYVELLWNSLVHLGISDKRKERNFKLIPTHDVDLPKMWWGFGDFVKTLAGDVFKRKELKSVVWSITTYFKVLMGDKDPFDTFDFLMDLSEKNNVKSHFFFMSGGNSGYDNKYKISSLSIRHLMEKITVRGHVIGFHPSYNAYNQGELFREELMRLNEYSPLKVDSGREHFLRFEVPETWQIWENNGMVWDSSMSYADMEGFRCGVCYPFSVFNILEKRRLNLVEKPLIVMEGSLVTYQDLTVEEAYSKVNRLLQEVKKFNGDFVFLWHNSAFNTRTWRRYQIIYEKILNENSNSNWS